MAEPFTAFDQLGAPPAVAAMLRLFRDDLVRTAGTNLAGLLLYGGLARRRFRPGQSDVNVVVLLHDMSAPSLAAIGPVLRAAWRGAGVVPLLLTPAEVRRTAEAFPTKFVDIQEHHLLLAGVDPFVGLDVKRENLRLRTEQELHNLLLRLRRHYVTLGDEPAELSAVLANVARPLAIELASLLRLAGKPVQGEDRTAAIFAAAASAFELDGNALAQLADLRADGKPPEDAPAFYGKILASVASAAERAAQMKEGTP
jgi:hypothetical protein